jgi:apolipoprotein D and lipocalin family protein
VIRAGLVSLLLAGLAACAVVAPSYRDANANLSSQADFDPERYAGRWYEIASFPTLFQRGCSQTQAIYGATGTPGQLSVRNTCLRDGQQVVIEGSAIVTGPGRLSVRLDGVPVAAPYWVLWVDEDYQTAVVGVPSGRAGWILNRSPTLRADRLQSARAVLEFNGYDLSHLEMTPQ